MAALGFKRIDAHEHAQQKLRIAEHLAKRLPPPPPVAPPQPRPVGRPKKQRTADEAVSSAAAAAAAAAAEPPSKRARGTYTHWFASPYINDILAAYARVGRSARRTIAVLQAGAPDDRYSHLSASTLRSWFGADKQLLPRFQEQLDAGIAAHGGRGPTRALDTAPLADAEIRRVLLLMREAGTPVNARVIRWVMRAVMQQMAPALLDSLTLSQTFISRWAREQLQWRWRSRTTAASKLPLDWEVQGVQMAMRIAANMEMHRVRVTHRGLQQQRQLSYRFRLTRNFDFLLGS